MLRAKPNKFLLLAAVVPVVAFALSAGPADSTFRNLGMSKLDSTISCIQSVFGKPAIWDSSVRYWMDFTLSPCPDSQSALEQALAEQGVRVFDAQDFAFIADALLWRPRDPNADVHPHAVLKWNSIKIHFNLQKLYEKDELPEGAPQIASEILKSARMIPFNMSMLNNDGFPTPGAVETSLNIAIWEGRLGGEKGEAQSLVALIHAQPHSSTARLVYGEMRERRYVMLWDSPLFNILNGNIHFEDVNGDGQKEIVIDSMTYGNREYPILVVFDRSGKELTRQKMCLTDFGFTGGYGAEDGVCAIYGTDISFSENEEGPKDIYVTNWDDNQNHVFKLLNSIYVPGPPAPGPFPPAPPPPPLPPDPAQLNQEGLEQMRTRNYVSARIKFEQASLLAGDKNPEYADNLGFAFYREGKYDLSLYWFQKAIQLDPKRVVTYMNLGDALVKVNRNAEARDAYKKYLELAPNSKSAPDVQKKLDALSHTP